MTMMTTDHPIQGVVFYGKLARKFGKALPVKAENIAKAIGILEANFPRQFFEAIRDGKYRVWFERDGVKVPLESNDDLLLNVSPAVVHIQPVVKGKGRGFMVVLGAILIGAALIFSGGLAAGSFMGAMGAMSGTIWGTIASLGLGLAITGIGMLLTPMPEMGKEKDQPQSSLYSGQVNIIREGGAVPLCYGAPYVAATVISGGISVANK